VRFLLDTHSLLWAAFAPHRLGTRAAEVISNSRNNILVSAASAWEIATKVRLGRLPQADALEKDFVLKVVDAGYALRSITVKDGLRAGRLVGDHQDPFDRMIAAQALNDDIAVISADEKLDGFGIRRIW
jgi:PIN domain nuclease of toxin-antitoxin system